MPLEDDVKTLEEDIQKINKIFKRALSPAGILTAIFIGSVPILASAYNYGVLNNRVATLEEKQKKQDELITKLSTITDRLEIAVGKLETDSNR